MPSPIGHTLAGFAIGLLARPDPSASPGQLQSSPYLFPTLGALVAALPDADLLIPNFHRAATHSLGATALLIILTAVVTGQVTGRVRWRLVLLVAAAQGSHVLMDWLGADPTSPAGVQAFWPFDSRFYISGLDWFPQTERGLENPGAFDKNLRALLFELSTMAPLVLVSWWARLWATRRRRSLDPISVPDTPPPPSV